MFSQRKLLVDRSSYIAFKRKSIEKDFSFAEDSMYIEDWGTCICDNLWLVKDLQKQTKDFFNSAISPLSQNITVPSKFLLIKK